MATVLLAWDNDDGMRQQLSLTGACLSGKIPVRTFPLMLSMINGKVEEEMAILRPDSRNPQKFMS